MSRGVLDAAVMLDAMSGYDSNDPSSLGAAGKGNDQKILLDVLGHGSDNWSPTEKLEALMKYQTELHSLEGVTIGVPREFHAAELDHRIHKIWNDSLFMLQDAGATIKEISIPSLTSALPAYYMLACAEASSNLSRYDGVRYGYRSTNSKTSSEGNINKNSTLASSGVASLASDLHNEIAQTRGEAFGSEVLRRILTGTYVLSQSAYHDYYEKALHCRNLITRDISSQLEDVDCLLGPTTPILPFYVKSPPSVSAMYYNDILTVPANLAGLPAISVPAGLVYRDAGNMNEPSHMPVGVQLIGTRLGEAALVKIALAIEQRSGMSERLPTMIS